jgi:hypothetical protein
VKKIARVELCMCKADGWVEKPKRVVLSERFLYGTGRKNSFIRGETLESR